MFSPNQSIYQSLFLWLAVFNTAHGHVQMYIACWLITTVAIGNAYSGARQDICECPNDVTMTLVTLPYMTHDMCCSPSIRIQKKM